MSWLNFSGRTASEFPLNVSHGIHISPSLVQGHNPAADFFKTITPTLENYMQRRKADEIANQLLQDEGAPPQYQSKGAVGLNAWRQLRQFQDDQPDTATDDLNYLKLWQQTHPDETPDEPPHGPEYVDTPYGRMTAQQWMEYRRKATGRSTAAPKPDAWESMIPIARGEYDTTNQKFTGKDDGSYVQLQSPSGRQVFVPWASYQRHTQRFSGANAYRDKVQAAPPELPAPDVPPYGTASTPSSDEPPPDQATVIAQAKAAIAKGANPDAVRKRVEDAGYDSSDLY